MTEAGRLARFRFDTLCPPGIHSPSIDHHGEGAATMTKQMQDRITAARKELAAVVDRFGVKSRAAVRAAIVIDRLIDQSIEHSRQRQTAATSRRSEGEYRRDSIRAALRDAEVTEAILSADLARVEAIAAALRIDQEAAAASVSAHYSSLRAAHKRAQEASAQ